MSQMVFYCLQFVDEKMQVVKTHSIFNQSFSEPVYRYRNTPHVQSSEFGVLFVACSRVLIKLNDTFLSNSLYNSLLVIYTGSRFGRLKELRIMTYDHIPHSKWTPSIMEELRKLSLTSCMVMTASLCFHFFGYECARAASISMLAAKVPWCISSVISCVMIIFSY